MQEKYSKQAKNALLLANSTAQSCRHGYVGTEHILTGLLKEKEGTAGMLLTEYKLEEEKLLQTIEKLVAPSDTALLTKKPTGLLPADPLPASLLMGSLLLISLLLANLLMESLLTASPPAPGSLPRLRSPAPASWR